MNLKDKLNKRQYKDIWKSYCGFLDLSINEYMEIQNSLMLEQIELWSKSKLGKSILKGKVPKTIKEFKSMVPLTSYEDYSEILLEKQIEALPEKPILWIQTTWEGGKRPIKVAPYTRNMLDVYRKNVTACLILSTSKAKGEFNVEDTDKILYGLAPLPFATGLFPVALKEEIDIGFLPPVEDAVDMTFSERNKKGFKMAMQKDLEFFFGLGSVAHAVSLSLSSMSKSSSSGLSSLIKCKPKMLLRILTTKYRCSKERRSVKPKDLFNLKGFMVAGTDNRCYKDDLEDLWGVRPMELFAGTEPSIIGTETWTRNGMYFFPDTCFYEFIAEEDMHKALEDSGYRPKTYLMNEVVPGEKYEIVLTVLNGGAFARYRVGDVYRCVGLTNKEDETAIPRFEYIDRIPTIIDIAGFTRISEREIQSVIDISGLAIVDWTARKEYTSGNRPYMHIYIEVEKQYLLENKIDSSDIRELLTEHLKAIDEDYRNLEKILGMDPMTVTIVKVGAFESFKKNYNKDIFKINPEYSEIEALI